MAYSVHNFEQGDVLYASQLNEMDAQIALNEENISNGISSDMLASDYSANKTYSVGDYVNIKQTSWQNWFYKLKAVAPSVGQYPISEWGQFDSFWRLCKWADMNQSLRDTQYNYNP